MSRLNDNIKLLFLVFLRSYRKYWHWLTIASFAFLVHFLNIGVLPVLDRDEARYAQASRQMIETENYLKIKFQDEDRNKKPIGIHWIQTTVVKLIDLFENEDDYTESHIKGSSIWKYRMTSALGALLTVLVMFGVGRNIFGKEVAFIGSLSMTVSLALIAESHQAKTDAILLFIVTSIMLLFAEVRLNRKLSTLKFFLLWSLIGISILIKGPICLVIILLSLIFLFLNERDYRWFLLTKPLYGMLISIFLAIPWFVFISTIDGGEFIKSSLYDDLIAKLFNIEESHGAFFGAHFMALWVLLWPFSLFLIPTLIVTWKEKNQKDISFLIAWIVPSWILFELIPTKLPHYTLPLYPAFMFLISKTITSIKYRHVFFSWPSYIGYFLAIFSGVFLITLSLFGVKKFGDYIELSVIISNFIIFLLILFTFLFLRYYKIKATFYYSVFLGCLVSLFLIGVNLPSMTGLWVSRNLAKEINQSKLNGEGAIVGFHEPSVVFELGTSFFLSNEENARQMIKRKQLDYIVIESRYDNEFNNIINHLYLVGNVKGYNAAKGQNVSLNIYKIIK